MSLSNQEINIEMHPRALEALGKDLVTSSVVAVIELAKNAYDAFASYVQIEFSSSKEHGLFLCVVDDGSGMTLDVIKNVWSVVGTPNKLNNTITMLDGKTRRVSGEKGLGRLSLARLGSEAYITTKTKYENNAIRVRWPDLFKEKSLNNCKIKVEHEHFTTSKRDTGTRIEIYDLFDNWDSSEIEELTESLSRMVSPFWDSKNFQIFLKRPNHLLEEPARIEAPAFLNNPNHRIVGEFNPVEKQVSYTYEYKNYQDESHNSHEDDIFTWTQFLTSPPLQEKRTFSDIPSIGPFKFDIRTWDIDKEGIQDIEDKYSIGKRKIRESIRTYMGISLYRDDILVLPKNENNRDWLGLDLRRVSSIGTRLSTSQIVGYVSIEADTNKGIKDASDRENLVKNKYSIEFTSLLISIVRILENYRNQRKQSEKKDAVRDLFNKSRIDSFLDDIESLSKENAPISDAIPIIERLSEDIDNASEEIQERFSYYSRLATVGSIALYIIHEIRNRTSVIGRLLSVFNEENIPLPQKAKKFLLLADNAVKKLEELADTFNPLANRSFKRTDRSSSISTIINNCSTYFAGDIKKLKIDIKTNIKVNSINVDPGELETVFINLFNNSLYWLSKVKYERMISITSIKYKSGTRIIFNDNGPGIDIDDPSRILLPGVTTKPGGIGMGLCVVSEIVVEYEGKVKIVTPGRLGGFSIEFDFPERLIK